MRVYAKSGPLSVRAVAGSYVVLLGINLDEEASAGVLGFAIQRGEALEGASGSASTQWLRGMKTFPGSGIAPGTLVATNEHPIQSFLWSDFTPRPGRSYRYRIVAMRGIPGALVEGEEVWVTVSLEDEEKNADGTPARHAVYFNRGVAGSQAYTRRFGNRKPDDVPDREAWRWLSRGLYRGLLNFIGQANSPRYGLRAAVYEFQEGGTLAAFARAQKAGADVKIVFDAREKQHPSDPKKDKKHPAQGNREAIERAGLTGAAIPRRSDPGYIAHNKFIVLLEDGQPIQVWTGSTNVTVGGIFGHSNVGHVVRDPDVAARYLAYWEALAGDPAMADLRAWNEANSTVPGALPERGTGVMFSPRRSLEALEWYAARMDAAQTATFLTAAFGVTDDFEEVYARDRDYLRYLMLETEDNNMDVLRTDPDVRIAVGNVLRENAFERWLEEQLTGLNRHVRYIHTKYLLIDPLGDDPLVITGSANFSDASTRRNDENMLVIRGDTRVADIYLGEFMRLFQHFYFRYLANGRDPADGEPGGAAAATAGELRPDDAWREPYYRPGSVKFKERLYFAGER